VTFKGAEVLVTLRERTTSPTPDIPAGTLVFASLADPETGDQLIYRLELPGGDPSLLAGLDSVFEFELSPDGTRLAYTRSLGTYAGELWVLDLSSGESQRIVQDVGTIFTPRWHRDGKHIAFSAQTYLDDPSIPIFSIYSVRDDGEDLRVLAKPREGAIGIDWSPDGNRIAYLAGAEADIRVLDLPSGETVTVWSHRDGVASRPSWSPDGSLIAIEVRGGIYSVSSEPPFVSQRLTLSTTEVFDQSWSPTGDALFFTGRTAPGDDLDILFIDLETGEITVAAATEMEDSRPSFASN
jgi:Tol biopolymer transport system component